MFKSINICSREIMIAASKYIESPCVIVSISGKTTPFPDFYDNPNIKDILYLSFSDYEYEPKCITNEDAQNIADFIRKYENDNIDIYFHCRAGISRSSGCAAALMYYERGSADDIFDNDQYSPNMKCFCRVLKALGIRITMDEYERLEEMKFKRY